MGARSSQFLSEKDEIDDAITQLRRRFRLDRVRDFRTILFYMHFNAVVSAREGEVLTD